MKQRLLIIFFTALVFGAGYGAHSWIADDVTVPPPPAAIGSEFAHGPGTPPPSSAAADPKAAKPSPPLDRTKMMGEISRYSSQIKTYQTRLDQLDTDFDRTFVPMLTDTQRTAYGVMQKRWADRRAKGEAALAAETAPLSDEQIFRLQRVPLMGVLSSVSISMRYDTLNKDLKFDAAQNARVHDLLRTRRDQFLELIDATPPPSITLSQLALHAEKLGAEAAKPAPAK